MDELSIASLSMQQEGSTITLVSDEVRLGELPEVEHHSQIVTNLVLNYEQILQMVNMQRAFGDMM